MKSESSYSLVQIGKGTKPHAPIGMGCSFYGVSDWQGQQGNDILAAMETAMDNGVTHFDTADGYGNGESERLIGRFLSADSSRRERMFLASKSNLDDLSAEAMLKAIDASCQRLQTDYIDLYYIHWPRTGKDLRPMMEGLETARQRGKVRAVGVSNFSVEQMEQVSEVTKLDAHQLGYSLLWRFPEKEIIPYCIENDISVVVYSALAHGILSGKYERTLSFDPNDQRWSILLFRDEVWPSVYTSVEKFKAIAEETEQSPVHLALRWLLHQPGVKAVLASAKNPAQALSNARALASQLDEAVVAELTKISDEAIAHIPDEGNPFGYHP